MSRVVALVVSVLLFSTLPALGGTFKAGARVLAQYKGGDTWYVGKVVSHKGSKVEVAYPDGTSETLPSGHVRAFDWKAGTRVTCKFKRGENWYPGEITSVKGDKLHIKYDDGDQEDTTARYCRE